jgi:16S rRNA (guanine966-N2)-methyltransferase
MRIVGGRWAGRQLTSPAGRVRPTAEAVREAWLGAIEEELAGARVLDLYAGSGALGLEALSRGARSCDFVENGPSALHALKANVAALRVRDRTRVFVRDALQHVERLGPDSYDVVLADPPYGSRQLDRLVERWLDAPFSRLLAVEHATDHVLPARGHSRRYGDTTVTTLRNVE